MKNSATSNVPFVATDVSDLKEIAHNSPGCSVVQADTVEELARGVLKAFETVDRHGRQDLRQNIAFLRASYVARRVKGVYETVLSDSRTAVDSRLSAMREAS